MTRWLFIPLLILNMHVTAEIQPSLTVTGIGKTLVKATITDIRVGLEVEGTTIKEVQERLASRLDPLLDAIKKKQPQKLETSSMSIIPEYNKNNPPQIVGYRGTVEVLMSKEANLAGELIEEALKNGANRLNHVSLRPEEADLRAARNTSLEKACQNAIEESKIVLKALNIESRGIKQVEIQPESHIGPIPLAFSNRMAMKADVGESLEVLEQEQMINASINLKIILENPKNQSKAL